MRQITAGKETPIEERDASPLGAIDAQDWKETSTCQHTQKEGAYGQIGRSRIQR
jgi:hypothetical protein